MLQRFPAPGGERHHALFVAPSVEDLHSTGGQVEVLLHELDKLGAPDARVEESKQDRSVPGTHGRVGVTAGEEPYDLILGEGLDDPLGEPHIAQRAEGALLEVAGQDEPVEEAADSRK